MPHNDIRLADDPSWWRSAVIYQVYIRSFADGDRDGIGDIAGLRERLPYLADLGIDAIWINPWYRSPMADGGYDVADYRDIDPVLGTMAEAEAAIAEAHAAGLRVILDLVPNHTSVRHEWFREAMAAGRGSAERARYMFREGKGDNGDLPPNDWRSIFGGAAWTRVAEPDGTPGQWYLHLFDSTQPDLDWTNERVRAEFDDILRFWFDRGVDGFRIDVAHGMAKDQLLPDVGPGHHDDLLAAAESGQHPYFDRDDVHEIYRRWRGIADSYAVPRIFVAEAWVPGPGRMAGYVRPDELHTAFNFDFLRSPWLAKPLRTTIDDSLAALAPVGAPATWVLSNHDVVRHVSRFGRPQDRPAHEMRHLVGRPMDLPLGIRRARAAALLTLALPGGAYVYQGEELGLWEVEDLPAEARQDPTFRRTGGADLGRDGCRVPLPWEGARPPFSASGASWLPQPEQWAELTALRQAGDPGSMLELYRAALRIRRTDPGFAGETLTWLDSPEDVLLFERVDGLRCAVNLGETPYSLAADVEVLLASTESPTTELPGGELPADTTVWFRTR